MSHSRQQVADLVLEKYADVFGSRPKSLASATLEEDEDGRVQDLLARVTEELELDELDDDVAENLADLVDFLVARLEDRDDG